MSAWQRTVTQHFQRAALSYANASDLQQASAQDLLAACSAHGLTLELGAGHCQLAGRLAQREAVSAMLAMDISEAMLRAAPVQAKLTRMVASALAIPLQDHSVDTVVSHFALHWCLAPNAVAAELHRVLRPNGLAQIAIPIAGSLAPLHGEQGDGALLLPLSSWQQAFCLDPLSSADPQHDDSRHPVQRWQLHSSTVTPYTRYADSAIAWLRYLQAMGVTASPQAASGLAGKQRHRRLLARLEHAAEAEGIPFTFQVWHAGLRACAD